MNDPHVEALEYRLAAEPRLIIQDAKPLQVSHPSFEGTLLNLKLRCSMKEHFATADEARELVEPVLRSWETHSWLEGYGTFSFEFVTAHLIDRTPPLPQSGSLNILVGEAILAASGTVTTITTTRKNPTPPPLHSFLATDSVLRMHKRFEEYQQNSNLLTHMANFCLTEVERVFGGNARQKRKVAAKRLQLDDEILNRIGRLSGNVGDLDTTARKAGVQDARPHTPSERRWMEEAVKLLILRSGERAATPDGDLRYKSLADVPSM